MYEKNPSHSASILYVAKGPRAATSHYPLGLATGHKVIRPSFRRVALSPPPAVRHSSLSFYAGSARIHWLRFALPFNMVACSPFTARATPLCLCPAASCDFCFVPCGAMVRPRVLASCSVALHKCPPRYALAQSALTGVGRGLPPRCSSPLGQDGY